MKKIYILCFLIFIYKSNAQYTSIPDTDFEQELIAQGFDVNLTPDGQILTSAINTLTSLDIYSNNLHNIVGIEDFSSLEYLHINYCNNLTHLDLSGNNNLLGLMCTDNSLLSINISNNPLLGYISCLGNELTTIDFSNNANLVNIICSNNNISNIDVSNNTNLVQFFCNNNLLTSLDISNNSLLKLLSCNNNLLTLLTITNVPQFIRLHCENNQLTALNTSGFPSIKNLYIQNNLLTELNLENNSQLNILFCNNNNISNLVIQNGANNLLNGTFSNNGNPPIYFNRFDSTSNSNLHCIFVNDVNNCNTNWLGKDTISNYVNTQQECNNLQNEEFISNSFTIYPNPVNDTLFIKNNNNNIIQKTVVYDLMSKVIIEQKGNSSEINFLNISSGLYLVKIATEKEIIIKKIVKN